MNWIKRNAEQLAVFIVAYVFFLLTLAANFSGAHDSITYLNGIVNGYPLINQHHLLYHAVAHYWFVLVQPIFPRVEEYYIVEAFTAIWGAGSLVVVYSFFRRRFNLPVFTSVAALAVVAFTYGFWFYSVNVEVYAPPMFFLLVALYIMTRQIRKKGDLSKIIVLHILAILFHQINILFGIVVLYKLWVERKEINLVKAIAGYALAGIVFVGGAYFLTGWVLEGHGSFDKWFYWMKGYASNDLYWHPLNLKLPGHALIGYSHAFVGGHFMLQIPEVHSYIDNSLAVHYLRDELFLIRNSSPSFVVLLSILAIMLAVVMIWLLVNFILKFRAIYRSHIKLVPPLMICWAVYSLFFCFWMPEILEFWLLQTVLLWLLLLGNSAQLRFPFRINTNTGITFMAASLFTINFFGSIRPLMKLENDWYYHKVVPVKNVVGPNDLILLQDGWILKDFMEYFGKANVALVPWLDSQVSLVDSAITQTLGQKGKIYVYPEPNNMKFAPFTRYIDSVLLIYSDRKRIFNEKDPRIIVIE